MTDMDVKTIYLRSVDYFADRVGTVSDDQWADATPCVDWDVRGLVNHVTYEDLWTVPLMRGATIEEVASLLGHRSIATTAVYLARLEPEHDARWHDVAAKVGILAGDG